MFFISFFVDKNFDPRHRHRRRRRRHLRHRRHRRRRRRCRHCRRRHFFRHAKLFRGRQIF